MVNAQMLNFLFFFSEFNIVKGRSTLIYLMPPVNANSPYTVVQFSYCDYESVIKDFTEVPFFK